jgi:hypothetical protein
MSNSQVDVMVSEDFHRLESWVFLDHMEAEGPCHLETVSILLISCSVGKDRLPYLEEVGIPERHLFGQRE